jgi:hypothetical protein
LNLFSGKLWNKLFGKLDARKIRIKILKFLKFRSQNVSQKLQKIPKGK